MSRTTTPPRRWKKRWPGCRRCATGRSWAPSPGSTCLRVVAPVGVWFGDRRGRPLGGTCTAGAATSTVRSRPSRWERSPSGSDRARDRYQQFAETARALLSDFREVEANFRRLDRDLRERITTWDGAKGELLDEVVGGRSHIADSDQGRSFQAFYDLLLSPQPATGTD